MCVRSDEMRVVSLRDQQAGEVPYGDSRGRVLRDGKSGC